MSEVLEQKVDRLIEALGALKDLQAKVEGLKAEVIAECLERGVYRVKGARGEAVVYQSDKRVTAYRLAIDEIVQTFGLPEDKVERIIEWNTRVAEGVPSIRIKPLDSAA